MPILPENPDRVPPLLQRIGSLGAVIGGIGIGLFKPGDIAMATISKSGVYTTKAGERFIGKEGDTLPDGWTYAGPVEGRGDVDPTALTAEDHAKIDADAKAKAEAEERSKGSAPQNKARFAAPENRSA